MTKQLIAVLTECAEVFRGYAAMKSEQKLDAGALEDLEMVERCQLVIAAHESVPENQTFEQLKGLAMTLATYAMNGAHGAVFEPFELDNVVFLAGKVGVKPNERHARMVKSRMVLNQIAVERKKQIDIFGYTADRDDANPEKLHQEIMDRVLAAPHPEQRKPLIEAAAIIVAEIESIDRRRKIHDETAMQSTAPLESL